MDRSISAERALLLLFLLAGPIVMAEWVIFSLLWGRAALWDGLGRVASTVVVFHKIEPGEPARISASAFVEKWPGLRSAMYLCVGVTKAFA
ncbi:hypothetical protein [Roseiflexus sp.]|uniref:hypothetical protein n=1 Tax=Roseiflexus sp. TaxID=2562120 RepID=UPI00398B7D4E